jgi:hypothetical protein
MLPLIERAGLNSNHMGRVMAAKAVLPFMDIDGIIPYVLHILADIEEIKENNWVHYRLVTSFHLLLSLQEFKTQEKYKQSVEKSMYTKVLETVGRLGGMTKRKQSAVISESIFKIVHHFLEHYRDELSQLRDYPEAIEALRKIF